MTPSDVPPEAFQEERDALGLMQSGQLELARHKMAVLSKKYPDVAKFHFNSALVLYKLKRFDEALTEVNAGLWLKPDDLKALRFKREICELQSGVETEEHACTAAPGAVNAAGGPSEGAEGTIIEGKASTGFDSPVPGEASQGDEPPAASRQETGAVGGPASAIGEQAAMQEPSRESPVEASDAAPCHDDMESAPATAGTVPAEGPRIETDFDLATAKAEGGEATAKDGIAGAQPETMPAVGLAPPEPVPPGPEAEVMPAVKMPALPEDAANPPVPEPIPTRTETGASRDPNTITEQALAGTTTATASDTLTDEARPGDVGKTASPATVAASEPPAEPVATTPTPPSQGGHPSAEEAGLAADETEASAIPVPESVEIDDAASTEPGHAPDRPPAEPELVSSIPEPSIVDTTDGDGQPSVVDEFIEVEPRIEIHEKAADITVSSLETSVPESAIAGQPGEGVEAVTQEQDSREGEGDAREAVASSPRLTNLKDLFKAPRAGLDTSREDTGDAGAVLADTVELEPGRGLSREGASSTAEESKLASFGSFKELDSYKFSIQALVEKYLRHKLDLELPDEEEDASPVILEDEAQAQDTFLYSESDLPPDEAAPADLAGSTAVEGPAADSSSTAEPVPDAQGGAVPVLDEGAVQQSAPGAPEPVPSGGGTGGALRNIAGSQEPIGDLLSAAGSCPSHLTEIDIMGFINASVMEKARTSSLMHVKGDNLAQIVDMETYTALVRSNRAIEKGKPSRVNTAGLASADQAIMEIEACAHPAASYRPSSLAREEHADGETLPAQTPPVNQAGMTDGDLANFIDLVRDVGEKHATMSADEDHASIKAAMARIKRVALELYNNTQY
ncbi:MAG: hypothetical protein JW839_21740, partial [Candidatus Lokiarchaeota archaeon]|nr:hypothetical protein [Candidatus Lokiarchaeota archaeon]